MTSEMHELLKKHLHYNIPVDDKKLDEIIKYFKPITVECNTNLLSSGETCNKLYFLNKGSIRICYIEEWENKC